jgi:hypothetical protein
MAVGGALQSSLFELRPDMSLKVRGWRLKRSNFLFSSIIQDQI